MRSKNCNGNLVLTKKKSFFFKTCLFLFRIKTNDFKAFEGVLTSVNKLFSGVIL